jgi:hypothetical protein
VRALATLTGLTSLELSFNEIGAAGARALAKLTGLTSLKLGGNEIGDAGARSLAKLTGLNHLDLTFNRIGDEGARALVKSIGLTSLDLSDNQIGAEGARSLARLTGLTSLNLSGNQIGDVGARALAKLTALTSLDLSENEIEAEGAHALTTLTGLISLDLSGNRIGAKGARALLESWCETSTLRILDLSGNGNMRSLLPPEVLASGNAQSILAAYRRYREAKIRNELRPLNEAKLVVVGNEAVGKTSLIRYLVHGKPRNPDEKKTPGTAIHEKIEDQLREAVAASTSYKLVCRRLGLSENGGNMYHLRARARELGLDASHFGAGTIDRCTDDDIRHAVASSMSFVGVFEVLGVRPGGTSNAKLRARIQELGLETTHFRYSSGRHRGALIGVNYFCS